MHCYSDSDVNDTALEHTMQMKIADVSKFARLKQLVSAN